MGHGWRRTVPWAVAFVLISWQTSYAVGSLLQEFTYGAQAAPPSCNDELTCLFHSTNVTAETAQESLNHFTVRFGLNVNADDVFFGPSQTEEGVARFTTNFTVAPGNYDLTITVHRAGALRRSADELACTGAGILADMSAPTFTINGVADERLSEFFFPGASIFNGGGDADAAVSDVVQSQVILFRGRTVPDQFSLTFEMAASMFSNSCEVSARLGAPNLSTLVCDSCGYPGTPARTIDQDGLFVEVNIENKCGDGATQFPEQCDLGALNGDTSTCCDFDCRFKGQDRICRSAAGDCDQAESCSGNDRGCPPDINRPTGSACTSDNDPCTTDSCNAGGQCVHTPVPLPCPALCGNKHVDPGEDCDGGTEVYGVAGTCCGADCRFKPQGVLCPVGAPCDDGGSCSGTNVQCQNLGSSAGRPCPDEGDFCTEDRCNDVRQCAHTPKQELCPNLFCGNGQLDGSEECDAGSANGQPTSCCDATCKKRPDNSTCADALFCNVNDKCTNGVCGGSPGNPCSELGTCAVCDETNNVCDTSACNFCGNGQVDAGEDCDLGRLDNGASTNCCGSNCKYRPDNSSCTDQLFCNGGERCTAGVCGASTGSPCSRSCSVCDEANNVCDASACPVANPNLPAQPTRELLVAEIFDGDGDRYNTSAGGRVRGTLDLDANGDLRFTGADLARLPRCADDAVLVGRVCIDKYEAGVFENPPGEGSPFGDQFGLGVDDYPCADDGHDCRSLIFARSVQGMTPSRYVSWFQAQQACANVGKRLPTNAEWQMAVAGTPDTDAGDDQATTCNTNSGNVLVAAASRSACVSKWGIYDMVGNVDEWVAEWMPRATACPGWGAFSDDVMCLAGASETATNPGAQLRGGAANAGAGAGPFSIFPLSPSTAANGVGFRCSRAPF